MSLGLLALGFVAVLTVAYRLYGGWVARQFAIDDSRAAGRVGRDAEHQADRAPLRDMRCRIGRDALLLLQRSRLALQRSRDVLVLQHRRPRREVRRLHDAGVIALRPRTAVHRVGPRHGGEVIVAGITGQHVRVRTSTRQRVIAIAA